MDQRTNSSNRLQGSLLPLEALEIENRSAVGNPRSSEDRAKLTRGAWSDPRPVRGGDESAARGISVQTQRDVRREPAASQELRASPWRLY